MLYYTDPIYTLLSFSVAVQVQWGREARAEEITKKNRRDKEGEIGRRKRKEGRKEGRRTTRKKNSFCFWRKGVQEYRRMDQLNGGLRGEEEEKEKDTERQKGGGERENCWREHQQRERDEGEETIKKEGK